MKSHQLLWVCSPRGLHEVHPTQHPGLPALHCPAQAFGRFGAYEVFYLMYRGQLVPLSSFCFLSIGFHLNSLRLTCLSS